MGCVLGLFDIVELVGETSESLGLNHLVHGVGAISRLSVTVAIIEFLLVASDSPMLLDLAGLIHVRLSVLFKVFGSAWGVHMHILSNGEVGIFDVSHSNYLIACTPDFRDWVIVNSY